MKKTIFLFLLILFFLPLVKSKIVFEQNPKETYNLGDIIDINFTVQNNAQDYLTSYLNCNGNEILIFKQLTKIENKENFNFNAFASETGKCKIKIEFGGESASSNEFEISNDVDLNFEIKNKFLYPSETLTINGTVIKKNGENVEGIAIISIPDIINQTIDVSNGKFFFTHNLKERTLPQKYSVKIKVIENKRGFINEGVKEDQIEVKSKPYEIVIESPESIKPGGDISIKATLFDQGGNRIDNETLILKIFKLDNSLFYEGSLKSGENLSVFFLDNSTRGGWRINSYYGNVFSTKPIYIEENKKIDINFLNNSNSLEITNIGNIPYIGVLEIKISNSSSNKTLFLNLNLSKGESLIYNFDVEGNYDLFFKGKNFTKTFENIYLTGAASRKFALSLKSYFFILPLLFLLFLLFILRKRDLLKLPIIRKKITYIFFIKPQNPEILEEIFKKYNLKIHKLNKENFLSLVHSKKFSINEILELALKIHKYSSSIIVSSEKLENKASSIKSALLPRFLLDRIQGLTITENLYTQLSSLYSKGFAYYKEFKIRDKHIKLYKFVK